MHFPVKFLNVNICILILKLHWSLFLRIQLTKVSISLGNGMGPNRGQAIIWIDVDQDPGLLGHDESN